jgi:cytidine deaminase
MARKPTLPNDAPRELDRADLELIEAARDLIRRHHRPKWHTVAAALRGADGRIWTGLHLGTSVGRLAVCAEAVALGRAIIEGDGTIATAVAVRHPKPHEDSQEIAVVSPCGGCREMILDFAPLAWVILPDMQRHRIASLLPAPYRRQPRTGEQDEGV